MATDLRAALSTSPARLAPLLAVAVLALLSIGYVALFAQAVTLPVDGRFANARGSFAGGDFVLFYSAGRLAAQGEPAAAYDLTRYRAAHAEVMDAETPRAPWIYPPTTLLALRALGHLPPIEALWTWLALSALAGAGAAAIVGGWRLAPLGLLYPGIGQALVCGQNGAFSALLLAAVVRFWSAAPLAAGAALGVLSYKPQIMAVTLCAAFALRAWRVAGGALFVAFALVGLSLLVDGLAPWEALPAAFADLSAYLPSAPLVRARWVTAFGLALALGAGPGAAMAVQAAVGLAALAAVVLVWRRTDDPFARSAVLAAGTLLFTPYGYDYDLAILVVPAACLLARAPDLASLPARAVAMLALLWLLPLVSFPSALAFGGTPASLVLAAVLAGAFVQGGIPPARRMS
ncbi:MAG: DUF2029 domain-containing protein [Alphaproteobacteria bacterium]|nr:DUF2029 domain-containing protein [Alphaproteobacteria bacterium]